MRSVVMPRSIRWLKFAFVLMVTLAAIGILKELIFDEPSAWPASQGVVLSLAGGLVGFIACFVSVFVIIRYEHIHAAISHDHLDSGPQKFHAVATPRIGGVGLMLGLLPGLLIFNPQGGPDAFGWLLLAAVPAFLGGVVEDVTKVVSITSRLLLTMVSGLLGSFLLGGTLVSLDLPVIDHLLAVFPLAILFTAFCVAGIANSFNIIDGYNGLASGKGLIALLAIAVVASWHGDSFVLFASLLMVGSLAGFFFWNWPYGRIFLGDGGAYLLGFWLAELSILLVVRNPGVSPWFPLLLLVHPVCETLFSVYRRKYLHQAHPGMPDSMHFHQMVYKRLVRYHVGSKRPGDKTIRNSLVAPYFWGLSLCFSLLAVWLSANTPALVCGVIAYVVLYVYLYRVFFRWQLPRVLRLLRGHTPVSGR